MPHDKNVPEQACPKTGRSLIPRGKCPWLGWLFPVVGFLSLIWFLVRVVPKPSRAAYPCQRVAGPLATGFLIWLAGVLATVFAYGKAKELVRRSRWGWAAICLTIAVVAGLVALENTPSEPVVAAESSPNVPIGVGRGIHPGRVVWVYDPDATDWDGYDSPEHWWASDHTNLAVVEKMVSQAVRALAGQSSDAAGWDAIFRYFNANRGNGDRGYQVGEKIAIKINLVTCNASGNQVDPVTYNKLPEIMNRIDNSPQMILALLRQLVYTVGVDQSDITIGDPTGMVPNFYWNMLHPEFPNVHYLDNYGGSGRTRAEFSNVPFYWSTPAAAGKTQDYLPVSFADADYMINFAVLKGHSSGVTLCAKNHYGSLIRCPNGYLRDVGYPGYYNTHLSLPNAPWSPGMGHYRSLVDLMGHPELGGKTVLYLIDGLFGGYYWEAHPYKWTSAPFGDGVNGDWPSSLFASQDPVAIDSVAYDFLLEEWPGVVAYAGLQGGAEDYLHEAALADNPPSGTFYDPDNDGVPMESLGVHEHWNNPTDKQYSRNLNPDGEGIELISYLSGNYSPQVEAGPDHTITLPAMDTVNLDATVSDDGLPDPPGAVTTTWTKVSGPGTVTFGDPGAVDTTATFSEPGTYVLQLQANDGEATVADTVTITVLLDEFPVVRDVLVSSTTWTGSFLTGLGSAGYPIPVGSGDQLLTLPWINIDQIQVVFSEDVTVKDTDLSLVGVNVPAYALRDFSYDANTSTATWTLTDVIDADRLLIVLSDGVQDQTGNALDGDWTDGVSTYPSGNGTAGGEFQFRFNVLPGDVNQNRSVFGDDVILTRNAQFTFPGDPGYSIFYDVDGSGSIFGNDVILVRNRQFTFLPSGETPGLAVEESADASHAIVPTDVPANAMIAESDEAATVEFEKDIAPGPCTLPAAAIIVCLCVAIFALSGPGSPSGKRPPISSQGRIRIVSY